MLVPTGRKENDMDTWIYVWRELKSKLEGREPVELTDAMTENLFASIASGLKGHKDFELIKHLVRAHELLSFHVKHTEPSGQLTFLVGMQTAVELMLYAAKNRGT